MLADAGWRAMYAAGERFDLDPAIAPRLVTWLGAMLAMFAAIAAWPGSAAERRRLAGLALIGLGVAAAAAAVPAAARGAIDVAHGWTCALAAAALAAALGWIAVLRRPDGAGLRLATIATTLALLTGAVVREAPRIAVIEHGRATAIASGGLPVFAITVAIGALAIAWIVRTARAAARSH
jgi:hypothetical protein